LTKKQKIAAAIRVLSAVTVLAALVFSPERIKAVVFYGVLFLWLVGEVVRRLTLNERIERWSKNRARQKILAIRRARWKVKVGASGKPTDV